MLMHYLLIFFLLTFLPSSFLAKESLKRWVVYYSNEASLSEFAPFSLIVLDSHFHPPLAGLIEQKKELLGYLSLGEVESFRFYYREVKNQGLLLEQNPEWKDAHLIDLRNPKWAKRIIEELIPSILQKGFNGIFLDTLDNAEFLETKDPIKYKGMQEAAIRLVRSIRLNYPQMPIMVNRAFTLLPAIANDIDMVLAESLYSFYNIKKRTFELTPNKEYQQQVEMLKELKKNHPHLQIYTLDFWDPNDKKTISNIYQLERSHGFIPYVSTHALDQIFSPE